MFSGALIGRAVAGVLMLIASSGGGSAYVRVNQVGYSSSAPKRALLIATRPETGATFSAVSSSGASVLSGRVGASIGRWNHAFAYVYALDLSALRQPGTYTIVVNGPLMANSPSVRIAAGSALYRPLLGNARLFFEAQRDGPHVVASGLGRRPSHLNDEHAFVYGRPDDRNVIGTLRRVGGPVDVSGGWADAGDYLKFVETSSYVEATMLVAIRSHPSLFGSGTPSDLLPEARFGLDWLLKMFDDRTGTLLYQVGVGDGDGGWLGDHDVWRAPQVDDRLTARSERYLAHRPVLREGPPGTPISPNLAGRLAADFGLCFQILRRQSPTVAARCLRAGEHVFALADVAPRSLTTASPYDYYPETEWRDDLELGATELALALSSGRAPAGLAHASAHYYLVRAARWARAYLRHANDVGYDTLNLYDVSGLAHAELDRAITRARRPGRLAVTRANLLDDCTSVTGSRTDCGTLRDQLRQAAGFAAKDPFGLGFSYPDGDVVPHALGVAVEAGLYDGLTHTSAFSALAQHQLDFVLGANAWGSSFVVGAGSVFPHCLQHQVANLAGALNGTRPLLLGATVDGPNADASSGLPATAAGTATPRSCSVAGFSAFSGRGVVYRDGVADWPNTEPTDDYTAATLLAFAQAADGP